jgi:hypothetical protein
MPEIQRMGEKIAASAQQLVDQELDAVEGGVDNAIASTKDAVGELRNEAEDIIDRAFGRFKELWEAQQPQVEKYIASHPWLVLGGFLLVGYLIAGARQRNSLVSGRKASRAEEDTATFDVNALSPTRGGVLTRTNFLY